MTGTIRWGVAGTGSIAGSFVNDFARLDDTEGCEIMAVGSRMAETAAAFADNHSIARGHGSYEELAADPEVDVVYVAGLQTVHAEHAELFLGAGKHVLVEKPIALDVPQVDRMIAAAEANDRFLMEAMWMRFNPAHVELMRRLEQGDIGEVRRVIADFSLGIPFDPEHRLWNRSKGGGALLDLGVYPLALAWWVLGPPGTVHAHGHVGSTGVDDELTILCGWNSGATAALTTGLRLNGTLAARIEGTDGAVEIPAPAHCTDTMTLRRGAETEHITGDAAGLHHQVREVHRCLRSGERESPRMTWSTSRALIERCETILAELGVRYDTDD